MCSQGISQFYLHTHTFIHNRNEPYLPLPCQPQLVLIYRPRRDGRLSRPWCKVSQAEIWIRNLPTANPALYHTATSAPVLVERWQWASSPAVLPSTGLGILPDRFCYSFSPVVVTYRYSLCRFGVLIWITHCNWHECGMNLRSAMAHWLGAGLFPSNLLSFPASTYVSCWWHQEGQLARIVPEHQKSPTWHMDTSEPL